MQNFYSIVESEKILQISSENLLPKIFFFPDPTRFPQFFEIWGGGALPHVNLS